MSARKFCPHCGHRVSGQARTCMHCHSSLEPQAASLDASDAPDELDELDKTRLDRGGSEGDPSLAIIDDLGEADRTAISQGPRDAAEFLSSQAVLPSQNPFDQVPPPAASAYYPANSPHSPHPGDSGFYPSMPPHPGDSGYYPAMPSHPGESGYYPASSPPPHPGDSGYYPAMPPHLGASGMYPSSPGASGVMYPSSPQMSGEMWATPSQDAWNNPWASGEAWSMSASQACGA